MRIFSFVLLMLSLGGCSSLFYYPTKGQHYRPEKINLQYENIVFPDAEGKKIYAWYFPVQNVDNKKSKGTFLFFHGNAENRTSHFVGLHWLPALGYNYLIFDYPGYDESEGTPSPQSTVNSGKAALMWLAKNKPEAPIIIYGQSLGGNIALRVALEMKQQVPIKAVIIDGSFASYKSVARAVLAKSWITWAFQPLTYLVLSDAYAPQDIGTLPPIPLLVIHGEKDPVVPVTEGKKIFAQAQEPKQLWLLPEGQHGDSFFTEKGLYRQKLIDYLESL